MERNVVTLLETETTQNPILHLHPDQKKVKFASDTVDNEEMQKKKSNSNIYIVCCIFRKRDCSSDSDSGPDTNDYERQPKYRK